MNQLQGRWSPQTKRIVLLVMLVLFALILYRFQQVLPPLVLAFLLAFILDPVVDFLETKAKISRTLGTAIVLLVLLLILLASPAVAVPPMVEAVRSLNLDFAQIFARIAVEWDRLLAEPIVILGQQIDLGALGQDLDLRSIFGQFLQGTQVVFSSSLDVVMGFASTLFWFLFTLIATFYMIRDSDRIARGLDQLAPPSSKDDFVRLRQQITDVWQAFLRGQLLMGILLAVITTVVATVLGLPNALALGLLAGVMEFIPSIGPVIAAVPAVLIALFQGSTYLPLSNFWFAVLVLGVYLVIQQVENNVLLPRILGQSLNLHPLVVLVAVIAGGSLAGVLGFLVAAPMMATLRVLGDYIYRRLTDQDPFPENEQSSPPLRRHWLTSKIWDRLRRRALANRWKVRPARDGDRGDVEAICDRIWGGEDYVPKLWEEWLADPHGELSVVELDGQVVALGKLTRLADDEWWLEGLRVDPQYRRLGVAHMLQDRQLAVAQQVARGVLRLATASYNTTVHHMAERDGFRRVSSFKYYGADPLPGPCTLRPLVPDELAVAWALIDDSPVRRTSGGLYEVFWQWKALTRERLAAHVAAGEVVGVDSDGQLAAVAILPARPNARRIAVGYIDGTSEGITALTWCLRVLAANRHLEGVRLRPVNEPSLLRALEAAGAYMDGEHELWVLERPVAGRAAADRKAPAEADVQSVPA